MVFNLSFDYPIEIIFRNSLMTFIFFIFLFFASQSAPSFTCISCLFQLTSHIHLLILFREENITRSMRRKVHLGKMDIATNNPSTNQTRANTAILVIKTTMVRRVATRVRRTRQVVKSTVNEGEKSGGEWFLRSYCAQISFLLFFQEIKICLTKGFFLFVVNLAISTEWRRPYEEI